MTCCRLDLWDKQRRDKATDRRRNIQLPVSAQFAAR